MAKTITVKGIGKASAKPDYVVLTMEIESTHREYNQAMAMAADSIETLRSALADIGFKKDCIKTTDFDVRTKYENEKDRYGNYHRVFFGYVVSHSLKLSFDFDTDRLAKTLSAISTCLANPQLSVAFTVKDATAINEEMLHSATRNARRKAEILCAASGATLGDILAIDYNWGELSIFSRTRFDCCEEALAPMAMGCSIDIDPDDIDCSDTVTFVWEIK